MKAALTDVMEKCGRIAGDIAAGRSSSDRSLVDIAAAEKAIAAAEKALRDAESYIEVEGAVSAILVVVGEVKMFLFLKFKALVDNSSIFSTRQIH